MQRKLHGGFGPGDAGKGPAPSRHLASALPVLRVLTRRAYGFRSPEALITVAHPKRPLPTTTRTILKGLKQNSPTRTTVDPSFGHLTFPLSMLDSRWCPTRGAGQVWRLLARPTSRTSPAPPRTTGMIFRCGPARLRRTFWLPSTIFASTSTPSSRSHVNPLLTARPRSWRVPCAIRANRFATRCEGEQSFRPGWVFPLPTAADGVSWSGNIHPALLDIQPHLNRTACDSCHQPSRPRKWTL